MYGSDATWHVGTHAIKKPKNKKQIQNANTCKKSYEKLIKLMFCSTMLTSNSSFC